MTHSECTNYGVKCDDKVYFFFSGFPGFVGIPGLHGLKGQKGLPGVAGSYLNVIL